MTHRAVPRSFPAVRVAVPKAATAQTAPRHAATPRRHAHPAGTASLTPLPVLRGSWLYCLDFRRSARGSAVWHKHDAAGIANEIPSQLLLAGVANDFAFANQLIRR